MADPLRHRQTKGAATDMVDLTPPRHIPTLPVVTMRRQCVSLVVAYRRAPKSTAQCRYRPKAEARATFAWCQDPTFGSRPKAQFDPGGLFNFASVDLAANTMEM